MGLKNYRRFLSLCMHRTPWSFSHEFQREYNPTASFWGLIFVTKTLVEGSIQTRLTLTFSNELVAYHKYLLKIRYNHLLLWLISRLTLLIITEVTDVAMPWEKRQFLPHHFRKPSISNQDKVLILVDYICRLNGGPTYCVKSPVLVCLFQDFTVYTRGWRSDKCSEIIGTIGTFKIRWFFLEFRTQTFQEYPF